MRRQITLGIRALWVVKDPMILHADSEDSDQTGRTTKLIWVFAGRTVHFVGFVMRRLFCNLDESNERARFGVLLASLRSFFFYLHLIIYI